MNPLLLQAIVRVCRQRQSEGDCPTVAAFSVEQLENAVVELARASEDTLALLERGVQLMDGEDVLRAKLARAEKLIDVVSNLPMEGSVELDRALAEYEAAEYGGCANCGGVHGVDHRSGESHPCPLPSQEKP